MPYKDPKKQKEYQQKHYQQNKTQYYDRNQLRRAEAQASAYASLINGVILDIKSWNYWFNDKTKVVAYELTSLETFELMKRGCFYCGEFATTLDRLDSVLIHTVDNCVGCCYECNSAKGALDPKTFILQAVYRQTFIYYEDEDIWYHQKTKPRFDNYKRKSENQNRPFDITKGQFNDLIKGTCHYCKRMPDIFFGVDKLVPENGYTIGNVVTACANCNWCKRDCSVDEFTLRDMKITQRYLEGYFDANPHIPKNVKNTRLLS
jgi:5-methylcytosine-specific restriction endonuclease McrA